MARLRLVPIHCGSQASLLEPLAESLTGRLGLEVVRHYPSFDPEIAYDQSRGQYNSRILLGLLLKERRPGDDRVLGVTQVDLFIPVLTYVFGEAQLGGVAALVSSFRLDSALYGLPPSADLLARRLAKEAVHELGHTFGLLHCHDARCVMSSSTYVEGIDLKDEAFCGGCRARLTALRREEARRA